MKSRTVHLPTAREKRSRFITACIRAECKTSDSSSASVFQLAVRPMLGWNGILPAAHIYSIQRLIGPHVVRTVGGDSHIFRSTLTLADKNFAPPLRRHSTPRMNFWADAESRAGCSLIVQGRMPNWACAPGLRDGSGRLPRRGKGQFPVRRTCSEKYSSGGKIYIAKAWLLDVLSFL